MQGKQQSQFSARAVPYVPKPKPWFDAVMLTFCILVALLLLAVLGMAIYTSFIKLWPYDKSFSLRHYTFGLIDGGVIDAYFNSLKMALLAALFGTVFIFGCAYLLEKTRGVPAIRAVIRLLAAIPMGVPGMTLLKDTGEELAGKHAVIIGQSNIVGRPMALELLIERCTVTVCHSRTRDLPGLVRQADIVVAGVGKPNFVQGDWIKPGAIVIDVGINRGADGKLCGDVDFAAARERAA